MEKFCGNSSTDFWVGQSLGLCLSEISLHIPASLILSIFSIAYITKVVPLLPSQWPFSKLILIRVIADICILVKCFVYLVIFMLSFSIPFCHFPYFFVANNGATLVTLCCITLLDIFHGKTSWIHSRGPKLMLLTEVFCFYISSLQLWSGMVNLDFDKDKLAIFSLIFDPLFFGIRLLTKIPIIYPDESERMRRVRQMRQLNPNEVDQAPIQPNPSEVLSETSVGFLGKLMFTWISGTIYRGYRGELFSLHFLPLLPKSLNAKTLECSLNVEPICVKNKSRFSAAVPLISQLFAQFGREFLLLGLVRFISSSLSLLSPVFLNKFIGELMHVSADWKLAFLWGTSLIILKLLGIFLETVYAYWVDRYGLKVKVSVTTLVYRQFMHLRSYKLSEFSTGNLVNLLTSDSERVVNLAPSFNGLWSMPVEAVVAIWLLYYQIGVSCFVGVGFLVLLLPSNHLITKLIGKFSTDLMNYKDLRVKVSHGFR